MAFVSFLVLWGVYSYLRDDNLMPNKLTDQIKKHNKHVSTNPDSPIYQKKLKDLDKIGNVINEQNADIDAETKGQIKVAKKIFDIAQNLKEMQNILEQSYMDRASTLTDLRRLQREIVSIKNKTQAEIDNTEKWDPEFVYYLMIQENYTYQEVNAIKSLAENGLNTDEINYISELIKENSFMSRINAFKNQGGDNSRTIASQKTTKEKDEFTGSPEVGASAESKIIEMNYNKEDKEEMVYGNNQ